MTTKYLRAYEHYTDGLDVSPGSCPGCADCGVSTLWSPSRGYHATDEDYQLAEEPSFSWQACEACGSSLGGDRHPAHGVDEDDQIVHLDICTDCLMFSANGDLPEEWDGWAPDLTCAETTLEVWDERDRVHVDLKWQGETVVEWWDEDYHEAVEDGFLDPRDLHASAVQYANDLGL
jgi:hypothetical protein